MPDPIQSTPPTPEYSPPEGPKLVPQSEGPITQVALVDVPVSLSELAADCADKLAGVVVAAGANPTVRAAALLKAGWEVAQCVDNSQREDSVQATIIECTNRGGSPVGILENSVACQGVKR